MSDSGGEGFVVGAAYVAVNAEGEDFQPQVEAIVGESDVVVTVPVVPDGTGFRDKLIAEADAGGAEVAVPVRPDTTGFRMLLQEELADLMPVSVPVRPDTTGFTSTAEAEGGRAGEAAGSAFREAFDGSGQQLSLFDPATIDTEAEAAGEEAGGAFRGGFTSTAGEQLELFAPGPIEAEAATAGREAGAAFREALAAEGAGGQLSLFDLAGVEEKAAAAGSASGRAFTEGFDATTAAASPIAGMLAKGTGEAEVAGETAAAGFGGRFKSFLSGVPLFGGAGEKIAGDAEAAGESSGAGFLSRFGSRMSGAAESFAAAVPGFVSKAASAGQEAGDSLMGKLKGVISGGMPAMEVLIPSAFVAAAAIMASKFQSAMEQLHTQAGVGQDAIHGLSNDVLNLASKVGESPDSLSQALYHVESAFQSVGITGPHAMDLVKTAAEGARVGGADLVDVTNALDSAMVAHIGGIHSYGEAMGALNAIVGSGDMKMQDLANAMGTGIMAVAKSYGQSIYQVGAALATFGDNNIRGAKAATDLRMAMQAIQAPVAAGAAALQHLGLTQTQLGSEMEHHGLSAALQMFVQHLQDSKVPVADWGQYMTEIFGKRAGVGIGVLVDQLGRMQSKFPDIEKGAHDFGNAWADTQKTTSQKLKEMESGFEALMIRIGSGLLPILGDIFSAITRALPTIERFGEEIAHLVSPAVKDFFVGLKAIFTLLFGPLKDLTLAVGAMGLAWLALNVIMAINPFVAIGIAIVTLVGIIVRYHEEIWNVIKGTWDKIASFLKQWWPLFLVIVTGPMGLILAAIIKFHKQIFDAFKAVWDGLEKPVVEAFKKVKSAITGGFDKWWVSHGKEIKKVWNDIWGPLAKAFDIFSDGIKQDLDLFLNSIKKAFDIFWSGLKQDASGFWNALVGLFRDAEKVITTAWQAAWLLIGTYFKAAWDVMAAYLKVMLAMFEMVIKTAWDIIVGIFNVALDLVTGQWSKAWNDALTMVEQVWNNIQAFFKTIWDAISALFTQELNIITGFLSGAWSAITSDINTAWNAISQWFATWWDDEYQHWKTVIANVIQMYKQAWDTVWGGIKSAWGEIEGWFANWWSKEISGWKNIIATVKSIFDECWKTIKSDAVTVWDDIKRFLDLTEADIVKGFKGVVSGIKLAWSDLKDIFDNPVKFLVDIVYDKGIRALWNAVASKIPDIPTMPTVTMASGGKLPGYGGGDHVPALLEPGETVVSKEHSKQLAGAFGAVGVPGYAAGGIPNPIKGIGHAIGDVGHAIGGAIGKVVSSVETGSITALKDALRAVIKTSATGLVGKIMTGVPETLVTDMVKGVIHKIESIIPGGSTAGGGHETAAEGQIASWWTGAGGPGGDTAKIAAAITGAESSFNVKSVQQGQPYNSTGWGLWQITPGNSEPSAGIDDQLLTGPTNAKAAVLKYRGAGDSFSPWTTYMSGAYKAFLASGGLIPPGGAGIPQSRWYDQGGMLMPGATMAMNGTGQPEMILPPSLGNALTSTSGPIAQLTQSIVNPGGAMVGLERALTDQGMPVAYLTRTLVNPGGPMSTLQKALVNPGGPMTGLSKTITDPGGPMIGLSKTIANPGGPMVDLKSTIADPGGPMVRLANALKNFNPGGTEKGSGPGVNPGGLDQPAAAPKKTSSTNPGGTETGTPVYNVNVTYSGTQYPTPEQEQAMLLKLGAAIGVA